MVKDYYLDNMASIEAQSSKTPASRGHKNAPLKKSLSSGLNPSYKRARSSERHDDQSSPERSSSSKSVPISKSRELPVKPRVKEENSGQRIKTGRKHDNTRELLTNAGTVLTSPTDLALPANSIAGANIDEHLWHAQEDELKASMGSGGSYLLADEVMMARCIALSSELEAAPWDQFSDRVRRLHLFET